MRQTPIHQMQSSASTIEPREAFVENITSLFFATLAIVAAAGLFLTSEQELVEIIFSYPGIGSILFAAIAGKDYFVIQGIVYILILSLGICLFLIDLLYPLIDPRIKYTD